MSDELPASGQGSGDLLNQRYPEKAYYLGRVSMIEAYKVLAERDSNGF